jgi:hypothetical protein
MRQLPPEIALAQMRTTPPKQLMAAAIMEYTTQKSGRSPNQATKSQQRHTMMKASTKSYDKPSQSC